MACCKTCKHPEVKEIERRQAAGEPLRQLKAKFPQLSLGGLSRHFSRCVPTRRFIEDRRSEAAARRRERVEASSEVFAVEESGDLNEAKMGQAARCGDDDGDELERLTRLRERALSILDEAEKTGDGRLAVSSIRELRQLIELEGRFTGKLLRPEAEGPGRFFFILPSEPSFGRRKAVAEIEACAGAPGEDGRAEIE